MYVSQQWKFWTYNVILQITDANIFTGCRYTEGSDTRLRWSCQCKVYRHSCLFGATAEQRDIISRTLPIFRQTFVNWPSTTLNSLFFDYFHFITALHVMQTWYSDENSVCLSVCHTRDHWQNGRKICPDLYTKRKNIYPSFLRRIMVCGGDLFYLKFWVNRPPLERNRRFSTNNRS